MFVFSSVIFSQTKEKNVFFKDCTSVEFKTQLELSSPNYLLIDLRSLKEFKKERIKTAKSVKDDKSLLKIAAKQDKNTPIFIYCSTGDKSISSAALLMRNGYTKIYNLQDGIDGWYGDGYKLCRDKIDSSDLVHL